jgi:hypothetical protein
MLQTRRYGAPRSANRDPHLPLAWAYGRDPLADNGVTYSRMWRRYVCSAVVG